MQGVTDYEPRVVEQLLDFLYRYVSETLQDADVRICALPELCLTCVARHQQLSGFKLQ